jgi:hypothetical protein
MTLTVYNTTTKSVREVKLTPSANWPGSGLLGITMQLGSYATLAKGSSPNLAAPGAAKASSPQAHAGIRAN